MDDEKENHFVFHPNCFGIIPELKAIITTEMPIPSSTHLVIISYGKGIKITAYKF